jgi:hypothetical protein
MHRRTGNRGDRLVARALTAARVHRTPVEQVDYADDAQTASIEGRL